MKKLLLSTLLGATLFGLEIGAQLPHVVLEGDNGAKVTGEAFDSTMMMGKLSLIFHVDPDEKDTNEHLIQAVKAHEFDRSGFQSYAIINMAATWLPNFAIASSLESKQAEFPDTVYVKDLKKVVVDKWAIADDSSNIVLVNKEGKVLFIQEGKASDEDIQKLIKRIDANI